MLAMTTLAKPTAHADKPIFAMNRIYRYCEDSNRNPYQYAKAATIVARDYTKTGVRNMMNG